MSNIQPAANEVAYIRDGQGVSHPLCDLKAREELATKAENKALEDYAPKDHTHKRFDNNVEIGGNYLIQVKTIKGGQGIIIENEEGTAKVHVDMKGNVYIAHKLTGGKTEIGCIDEKGEFSSLVEIFDSVIRFKRTINATGAIFSDDVTAGNILPSANGAYDIGNASHNGNVLRWKNVFAENVDTDDLTLSYGEKYLSERHLTATGCGDSTITKILTAIWKGLLAKTTTYYDKNPLGMNDDGSDITSVEKVDKPTYFAAPTIFNNDTYTHKVIPDVKGDNNYSVGMKDRPYKEGYFKNLYTDGIFNINGTPYNLSGGTSEITIPIKCTSVYVSSSGSDEVAPDEGTQYVDAEFVYPMTVDMFNTLFNNPSGKTFMFFDNEFESVIIKEKPTDEDYNNNLVITKQSNGLLTKLHFQSNREVIDGATANKVSETNVVDLEAYIRVLHREIFKNVSIIVDNALNSSSENPVQNKVIAAEFNKLGTAAKRGVATAITENGTNLVPSGLVYSLLKRIETLEEAVKKGGGSTDPDDGGGNSGGGSDDTRNYENVFDTKDENGGQIYSQSTVSISKTSKTFQVRTGDRIAINANAVFHDDAGYSHVDGGSVSVSCLGKDYSSGVLNAYEGSVDGDFVVQEADNGKFVTFEANCTACDTDDGDSNYSTAHVTSFEASLTINDKIVYSYFVEST